MNDVLIGDTKMSYRMAYARAFGENSLKKMEGFLSRSIDERELKSIEDRLLEVEGIRVQPLVNGLTKDEELAERIAEHAVDGYVYLAISGNDCDGCHYSGKVRKIEASVEAYHDFHAEEREWPDGPFCIQIVSEEEASEMSLLVESNETIAGPEI
ncbi:hypothetical protein Q9L42_020705 (plasmid) [Methylomarinum sp. Ch1-1]|uniref:Uncharacterized protein n=1 Tax=Methylomarinum roseum TaxID=3067653 RepID=A0AAU7P0H1_9GAMM|nr:hypothetical protein [Methylomarinum sp. Ch1-1]MDP4523340.1 hypothetical protein [Methylomarinum sp. Ch1-1]